MVRPPNEQPLARFAQSLVGPIERTADAVEALNDARGNGGCNVTSVGDSATVVTLLAALTGRTGAYFYNASTAILYLKLGSAATTSDYTVQLAGSGGAWALPFPYVGIITGIWASDAGGSVQCTEFV